MTAAPNPPTDGRQHPWGCACGRCDADGFTDGSHAGSPRESADGHRHDAPINYELLKRLAEKPHPLLNIADDFEQQIRTIPIAWVGEVFTAARTAHHLLDLANIPQGEGYAQDLDSRTWLAVAELAKVRGQLDRIAGWHVRATYPGGMVGDHCVECGLVWPCETRRMADGTHEDLAAPRWAMRVIARAATARTDAGRQAPEETP